MNFNVKGADEILTSQTQLLIQIFAHQRASTKVLIEAIGKSDEEKDELIEMLNSEFKIELDRVLEEVYVRNGHFDITKMMDDDGQKP